MRPAPIPATNSPMAAPTVSAPDEVIVKVGAAGLCRTDLHIIEGVWKDIMDT